MLSTKRLPVLLLAIAVLFTFGFDIFEFINTYQQATDGAPWSLFFSSLAESTVDIAALLAVYWLMKGNVRRLEELSESKSEILSIVSHDLRSPISMMMGFAQILDETQLTLDQRRMIRRILANGEQSIDLINNLLTVFLPNRKIFAFSGKRPKNSPHRWTRKNFGRCSTISSATRLSTRRPAPAFLYPAIARMKISKLGFMMRALD